MAKKWITGAIKKPGALREALGAKKGKPIPKAKIKKAAAQRTKAGGMTKLAERAQLAKILAKFPKKGRKKK